MVLIVQSKALQGPCIYLFTLARVKYSFLTLHRFFVI